MSPETQNNQLHQVSVNTINDNSIGETQKTTPEKVGHLRKFIASRALRIGLTLPVGIAGITAAEIVGQELDMLQENNAYAEDNYSYASAMDYKPDAYEWWVDENGNGKPDTTEELKDPLGYYYKNCTSFVGDKLQLLGVPKDKIMNLHNGGEWHKYAPNNNLNVGDAPEIGAVAVKPATYDQYGNIIDYGHVAIVKGITYDSNGKIASITVEEYNYSTRGKYGTRTGMPSSLGFSKFVYFAGLMDKDKLASYTSGTQTAPVDKSVTAISSQMENGTEHIYWATADGTLKETWKRPGILRTNTIKKFGSKITELTSEYTPVDMVQHIYAGTETGTIHEVWFGPNSGGYQFHEVTNLGARITALASRIESNYTQHLYWATQNGRVGETWFRPGQTPNGWQAFQSNSPVNALTDQYTSDGITHLYWGNDEGRLHETWFRPGVVHTNLMADFPSEITAISSQATPDGLQHAYTATADGILRETWFKPAQIDYNTSEIGGLGAAAPDLSSQFTANDGVQHIFAGTNKGNLSETWLTPGVVNGWPVPLNPKPESITAVSSQYTAEDNTQHIYWGASDGYLRETWFRPNNVNTWQLPG